MIWAVASVMIVIALVIILLPLWRSNHSARTLDSNTANVAVLRDQLQELEQDYASGNLSDEQYALARDELQASAAADLDDETVSPDRPVPASARRWISLLLIVLLPLSSIMLYRQVSTYRDVPQKSAEPGQAAGPDSQQQEMPPISEMVEVLAARLRQDPENLQGWKMLAKTYAILERIPEAVSAYERAYRLGGNQDAEMLVDYAEALAYANDNKVEGRPEELLEQALEIQPRMPKAMWLTGFGHFQKEDYVSAVGDWEQVVNDPNVSAESRTILVHYITEARKLGGLPEAQATRSPSATTKTTVTVHVSLDGKLGSQAKADDIVFVFARAVAGMPMPLAVRKLSVSDLPTTVVLDDSMAMMEGHSLADKRKVIVGARVSKAGTPVPQPGDLQGQTEEVELNGTAEVVVTIDQVVN